MYLFPKTEEMEVPGKLKEVNIFSKNQFQLFVYKIYLLFRPSHNKNFVNSKSQNIEKDLRNRGLEIKTNSYKLKKDEEP